MTYSSIAEVRSFSGVPESRVPDADITRAISIADAQINLLTGKVWDDQTITDEYQDASGYSSLRLDHYPLISITKLEVYQAGAWVEKDEWDPDTREGTWRVKKASAGILEWVTGTPGKANDSIRVTYHAGYTETPTYIKDLSIRVASIVALQQDAGQINPSGFQSIAEGALNVSWGAGAHDGRIRLLIQEVEKMLDQIGRKMEYAWSR
jgi:hypothetical protein